MNFFKKIITHIFDSLEQIKKSVEQQNECISKEQVQKKKSSPEVIKRQNYPDIPLHVKNKWEKVLDRPGVITGYYHFFNKRTNQKMRWHGEIHLNHIINVYIYDPPSVLRNHKHYQCFIHRGIGWYEVHFLNEIKGIDDAILNVQRLIAEAYICCS